MSPYRRRIPPFVEESPFLFLTRDEYLQGRCRAKTKSFGNKSEIGGMGG